MLVLVPFLNQQQQQNIFSNVMAQEYDKYGDSYYNTYQTDNKKYECRTGPFEGFFVSSVEFCKQVKFDDKDSNKRTHNNRTDTQDGDGNGVGTDQCAGDVEACFRQALNQSQFEMLSAKLASPEGINIDIPGVDSPKIRSFEDICSALQGLPFEQLQEDVIEILTQIFDSVPLPISSDTRVLVNCIVDAINR
jgi:hypothetical protein